MISSVNVTKSAGNCGLGHIYLKKSLMENFIFCAVFSVNKAIIIYENLIDFNICRD